jgi:hypothetical protein
MGEDAFWGFERTGWERAAEHYEALWLDEAIREAMSAGVARYADGDGFALPLPAMVVSAVA